MPFPVISYADWVKRGQFLPMEDGKVFYVHKGKGVPIVMVHHGGGNSWWWCRVLDTFAEQYSVYALDLPGFAQSEVPPLPYDVPDMAAAVKEFMEKLGIKKAHILGNSAGSQITTHFAVTWPAMVGKIALDIFPHWTRAEAKKLWRELFLPQLLDENELPVPWGERSHPGDTFGDLDEATRRVASERMARDFMEHGRWWVSFLKVGQLRYDVNPRLPLVRVPTLVVVGERGSSHIREGQEEVARAIPGARLVVIPKAGNRCHFETPEVYSKVVLDFLKGPS